MGSAMSRKTMKKLDYEAYTVALLCPLEIELSAARYLLDEEHHRLPSVDCDPNQYILGEMSGHNVVIASLPMGYQGTASAAAVAINLNRTFLRVHMRLLIGIGGGVPSEKVDIRLGDVVIGVPTGIYGGVVQYDLGKQHSTGFQRKGFLSPPPPAWLQAITMMKSSHRGASSKVPAFLEDMLQKHPRLEQYRRPPPEHDILFKPSYNHVKSQSSCQQCDRARIEKRASREPRNEPFIHYGLIASGARVMRDAVERDRISRDCGEAICFEMEAGLMNDFPCIVIRGISDYADSHKNDEWHAYAAAAAAALAKELLEYIEGDQGQHLSYRSSVSPDRQHNLALMIHPTKNSGREQNFETLLKSLTFVRLDARLLNIRAAYPKTCGWVSKQTEFKEWRDRTKITQHHGFLWIKGKPGSGKSTIMKELYRAAKASRGKIYGKTVSYFFNARAPGLLEKSSLGMYRSLIYQLLQALPQFQDSFLDWFDTKIMGNDVDDWSIPELQDFLTHVVKNLGSQALTIFIDALDEGEENDVRQMVAFLEELGENAVFYKTQLMVCLSSRHYPHISVRREVSLTVEGRAGHDEDISIYVRSHLNKDNSPEMEELRAKVCEKASGVFLWVVLVIPILNTLYDKGQLALMAERLNNIPSELDALFAQILARNKEDREKSVLLFQWTLFAERALSPTELFSAVTPELYHAKWDSRAPNKETVERYLLNCSKGLVEISKSDPPTVYFIHETVRAFLLQSNGLAEIQPELRGNIIGSSHKRLTMICHRYLYTLDESYVLNPSVLGKRMRSKEGVQNEEKDAIRTRLPFLDYAVNFMFNHAEYAEQNGISQKPLLEAYNASHSIELRRWIQCRNIFQRFKVRRYTPKATLLYILSEQNMHNLVRQLVKFSDVNFPGERYGNALQAACVNGHQDVARLLLNAGANVNALGGDSHHALLAAICSKNDTLVELIMNKGAIVPKIYLEKPLFSMIWRKYAFGVKALLQQGADVNCRVYGNTSALSAAARQGQQEIVKMLLNYGADIKSQGSDALRVASAQGHRQIVQMLIDNGVDVNGQDADGSIALHEACAHGRQHVFELLLDNGSNINARSRSYGSLIQAACIPKSAQVEMVQILLDKGADVNAQDGRYGTPLQLASANGNLQIIQMLLDRGAKVNAPGSNLSGTALFEACCRKDPQIQIIQTLLDNGADLNVPCNYYDIELVLRKICCMGHRHIISMFGMAPRIWRLKKERPATCEVHQQIVQMLLDKRDIKMDMRAESQSNQE